ncbi:hypothetical protein [Streptantibioticus silvisoli]|uniref:DUF5666 domain-containing protein n=1 Tax=Streptantibioticus silvisoli TaxID=2705255 RepID=A0ABT6VV35_9ACTN|nr:hypothetical protein [Streptantibioticus silvisoli]MDI5962020.1 hypothetical protein [Streptantibioticus silvisoli]
MARRRTDLVKAGAPAPAPEPSGELLPQPRTAPDTAELVLRPEEVLAVPPDARDISAELAAPPRRRLPWATLLLSGCVVAALAFTGGVLVEKNQSPAGARGGAAAFAGARGGAAGSGAAAGRTFGGTRGGTAAGAAGGAAGGAAAGMTTGTVKLVDGSTIYVSDAQGDIVKVTTAKSTTVSESKNGKVADLQPGQTVTVRGSADSSGDIKASTVTEGGLTGGFGGFGGGRGFGGGAAGGAGSSAGSGG